jgi:zinc-binding alcohol dehydrogenase/oxidoreductase
MKALVVQKNKKIAIEDVAIPKVGEGEVRVKIKAAALNKRDYWISVGKYPGILPGVVLGSDGAGVVDETGVGVDKKWLDKSVIINPNVNWGDNPLVQSKEYTILGMPTNGTFAEYVVVKEDRLNLIPDHLTSEEAASLPLAGLTAYRACMHYGEVNNKKKVLISGFGGGVAHIAFQFANAIGAQVSITSGQEHTLAKAIEMGAIHGFNYRDENWIQDASLRAGGFDLIIDSAGGDQFNDLIKILNPGGKIVFYGASNGLPTSLDLYRLFWKQGTIQGSTMGNDEEFAAMVKFVEEQRISPLVGRRYPFEQIENAIDQMGNESFPGKAVLVF